jgi:hyperosmotically inducible periplasmic protein
MKTTRILLAALVAGTLSAAGCANVGDKSVGAHIDDTTIATKIKSKFVADKTVEASDIKVTVFDGTVQLSGFAKTADEVRRAGEIARDTAGVKSVKNDVRLAQK